MTTASKRPDPTTPPAATGPSRSGHLAILGAGPVGLEAALAAAETGWSFTLYEAGDAPAANLRSWGHVRLFSPWELDVSERMRRRLADDGREVPDGGGCPTGAELAARVLEPLARSPAIAPHLRLGHRVRAIARDGLLKHQEIASERRAARPFRLLVERPGGEESVELATAVLDCTGTYGQPNALGDGGIPAPGEAALGEAIRRHLPDFTAEAAEWAGRSVLLVGGGHSAQTAARELAALATTAPGTRVLWALPEPEALRPDPDDPLPERRRLAERARELASGASPAVEPLPGVRVQRVARSGDGRLTAELAGRGEHREVEVDRILSLTGYVGDPTLHRQLQFHQCYATEGPMKLSAALLGAAGGGGDCLAPAEFGADVLVNPEPGFFVLGAKSYGRNSAFLMRNGFRQVDDVFSLLAAGGRPAAS